MEQFSLDKYLENPSRKVVTRSGHNVRILCTDQRGNMPIVALVEFETLDGVQIFYSDGKNESHREYDLFFADEEKELTEFEKAIKKLIESCCNEVEEANITNAGAKEISSHILDLARKELTKNLPQKNDPIFELLEIFGEWLEKNGYSFKFPKSDTLKDLPKWKDVSGKNGAGTKDYKIVGYYLVKGNYAIYLEDLEKLPKE